MRLGDLDALFRAIKNSDWLPHERIEAMKMVREQPTIDAVPVVRCKDCVHMTEHFGARFCEVWTMFNGDGDYGYCNYGKRRGDTDG